MDYTCRVPESLVTVVETPEFIRRIDKLMDDDERSALILYLAENPTAGDLIPGTGGVRKLRWGLEAAASAEAQGSFISSTMRSCRSFFSQHSRRRTG